MRQSWIVEYKYQKEDKWIQANSINKYIKLVLCESKLDIT